MSEIMKISKVMEISVLGYSFASFIKDFKKAYIQPDRTYDYMSYIAVVDPASYFMLANNLGDVGIANNYLNAMLTQTINNISVVNGGKKMKGGVDNFIPMIFTIGLLFLTGIQSSLAAETSHKDQRALDNFFRINGGPMSKPQTIVGYFWNTKPDPKQVALFDEQQELIRAAGTESDTNEAIIREEEGKIQQNLGMAQIQATKEVNLAEIPGQAMIDVYDEVINITNQSNKEKIDLINEFNDFKMAATVAFAGGALGFYVLNEKTKNDKTIEIQQYMLDMLPHDIAALVETGDVIVDNKKHKTSSKYLNYLTILLGKKYTNYGQVADRSGIDNSRRTTQNADRLGIEDSRGANQFADRFGLGRGGKYRKTRKSRKSRKSRKIRKH